MSPLSKNKVIYLFLKYVLLCGMNDWGSQYLGGIFTLQYTILKMTILLHKTALVNFPMATTVIFAHYAIKQNIIASSWKLIKKISNLCKSSEFHLKIFHVNKQNREFVGSKYQFLVSRFSLLELLIILFLCVLPKNLNIASFC